jgi:hypothetical protein
MRKKNECREVFRKWNGDDENYLGDLMLNLDEARMRVQDIMSGRSDNLYLIKMYDMIGKLAFSVHRAMRRECEKQENL